MTVDETGERDVEDALVNRPLFISKHRGVSDSGPAPNRLQRCRAQLEHNGIVVLSRHFRTETDAAAAYDDKVIEIGTCNGTKEFEWPSSLAYETEHQPFGFNLLTAANKKLMESTAEINAANRKDYLISKRGGKTQETKRKAAGAASAEFHGEPPLSNEVVRSRAQSMAEEIAKQTPLHGRTAFDVSGDDLTVPDALAEVYTPEEYRQLMNYFLQDFRADSKTVLKPLSGAKYCNEDRVLACARPMLELPYRVGMVDEILVYMHNQYGHVFKKLRILSSGETNAAGLIITYDLASPERMDDLLIHKVRNMMLIPRIAQTIFTRKGGLSLSKVFAGADDATRITPKAEIVRTLVARTQQALPSQADTTAILRHIAEPQVAKKDDIVHQLIEDMFYYDTRYYTEGKKLGLEPKRVPRDAFIEMLTKQQFRDDVSAAPFTLADFLETNVGDIMSISVNRLELGLDHGNHLHNLALTFYCLNVRVTLHYPRSWLHSHFNSRCLAAGRSSGKGRRRNMTTAGPRTTTWTELPRCPERGLHGLWTFCPRSSRGSSSWTM
jgi:hypothetical protein